MTCLQTLFRDMQHKPEEEFESWDVVVIGAGIYGIQAARTYLEIHPIAKLVILESDDVVGGVWSSGASCSSCLVNVAGRDS